jgi:RNA polymerase sigma-70 factor (ECF subfamily)
MQTSGKEEILLAAIQPPPPHDPPAAAPSAASSGCPSSLEALFQEHHARVYRAAYRITGNPTDAEDVLQTVFLRLLKREEAADLSSGAAGYLARAAVNAALDLLRARKRARRVDLGEVEGELPASDEGPEGHHHRRELARRLRGAVARLSPRAAEIFTLRYFQGYGNREIAELLDTSQTAVAVILHRSRHRLAKELAPLVGGTAS